MSGTPSEAEIQAQWKAAVDILDDTRAYAEGTVVGAGKLFDVLLQALEGDVTPVALANATNRYRAGLSSLVDRSRALEFLAPVLFEYGNVIGVGGGYADPALASRALYEHMVSSSQTIQSRGITFDTSATAGGSNVGNMVVKRLTVDENNFPLEACTVEQKRFRCRADANSGTKQWAETFEIIGETASVDWLLRGSFGSGNGGRQFLSCLHSGSGSGGSMLRNSSFDQFASSAFPNWTLTAAGAGITQVLATSYYRTNPNTTAATSGCLRMNGGGGTVTVKQTIERLNPDVPYFLRVMLNKTVGTASGGTVTIRLGSSSASVAIASAGSNWVELAIASGTGCWFRNFDETTLDVEIEWASSTSGYLLIDDVILSPWSMVDGTFWVVTHTAGTPVAALVDDTLDFTDTGGAAGTGKLQWWWWTAGYGYLPSAGSPTISDP